MKTNFKHYLVGGAVRDTLMGKPARDRDYVVIDRSADEMLEDGYICVGSDVSVFLHPETREEYTLADSTLEVDLARRDFTINAIAMDVESGKYIDPFDGRSDLESRILRHVGQSFREDPIRVLRCARFKAQFGLSICDKTFTLMKEMVQDGDLDDLTPERILLELDKALLTMRPSVFFNVLQSLGALEVVFPEIHKMIGISQPEEFHPEGDVYNHTMLVLDNLREKCSDPAVLFAGLLHDVGKISTPAQELPSHYQHPSLGEKHIHEICKRLSVPNSYRNLSLKVCSLHMKFHYLDVMKASKLVKLLEDLKHDRSDSYLANYILCCEADALGKESRGVYDKSRLLIQASKSIKELDFSDLNTRLKAQEITLESFLQQRLQLKVRAVKSCLE